MPDQTGSVTAPPIGAAPVMSRSQWAMLVALAVLWGGSFFFNEIAVRGIPVLSVVAGRVAIAAVILLAVMRLGGHALPRGRAIWGAFAVMGLLNNAIPFLLILWGQTRIASGTASILNATTPLFTVLLAHVLTVDERLSGARLAGVVAGFVGVAAMIGAGALAGPGGNVGAQLACLAGALSYALAGIFGRRFQAMGVAPLATAAGQVIASSVMLVPVAVVVDRPWTLPAPGAGALGAVLGIAALSTALAYVLYFRILAAAGATNLLLVTFLIPVSAILLGTLVLGEALYPRHLAGMALIAVGLAAIDGRMLARSRRR